MASGIPSRRGQGLSGLIPLHPLPTRDPVSGGELIVTRLECPASGIVIEGQFSLGWIGALTPEQLAFVGQLVRHRGNVQKLASELNVAYNTARSRLDAIVAALGGPAGDGGAAESGERPPPPPPAGS